MKNYNSKLKIFRLLKEQSKSLQLKQLPNLLKMAGIVNRRSEKPIKNAVLLRKWLENHCNKTAV